MKRFLRRLGHELKAALHFLSLHRAVIVKDSQAASTLLCLADPALAPVVSAVEKLGEEALEAIAKVDPC